MPSYKANITIGNLNQLLSKEHGITIQPGNVLTYEDGKVPAQIDKLEKIGVVTNIDQTEKSDNDEEPQNDVDPADPEGEDQPKADEQDQDDTQAPTPDDLKAILDKNAKETIKSIDESFSNEALALLVDLEKEDKNRSTVVEHIQSLIQE